METLLYDNLLKFKKIIDNAVLHNIDNVISDIESSVNEPLFTRKRAVSFEYEHETKIMRDAPFFTIGFKLVWPFQSGDEIFDYETEKRMLIDFLSGDFQRCSFLKMIETIVRDPILWNFFSTEGARYGIYDEDLRIINHYLYSSYYSEYERTDEEKKIIRKLLNFTLYFAESDFFCKVEPDSMQDKSIEKIKFHGTQEELAIITSILAHDLGLLKGSFWADISKHFRVFDEKEGVFKDVDPKQLAQKIHHPNMPNRKKTKKIIATFGKLKNAK